MGVQRKHTLLITFNIIAQILIALIFLIASIAIVRAFESEILSASLHIPIIITYITLTTISTLILFLFFSFMTWYYEFYVITNKAILHRKCFRTVGFYTEAVMLNQVHEQRIERDSTNIIFDLLKIQDIYVYFYRYEKEDPFIFRAPSNAQAIEDLLQNLITKSEINQKRYSNESS